MQHPVRCLLALACVVVSRLPLHAQQAHPAGIPVDLSVPFLPPVVNAEGMRHLMYELHVGNFGSAELTLTRIEVLDDKTSAVLASYEGDALEGILSRPGSPGLPNRRVIAGGLRAVAFLDVRAPSASTLPEHIRHRVTFLPITPANGSLQSIVEGERITMNRSVGTALGPPLEGSGWIASHGLSNASSHRRTLLAIDGKARIAQRFAVDWTRVGADGQVFRGDPAKNANWTPYGAAVLAIADGRVVQLQDGIPENDPTSDTKAIPITLTTVGGNYLILDLGDGRFAFYAHLQRGSFTVRAGARVRRGQVLARLGNSGQSDAPHLHLHVMNAPSPLAAEGLPLVFDAFDVEGHIPSLSVLTDGTGWRATQPRVSRRGEMPVENAVVAFPSRSSGLPSTRDAASFAIVHVTIVDVRDGTEAHDQTVIVRGSRISTIGNSAVVHPPRGADVVDGNGKFLIPGLWDMHTHVWNDSTNSSYSIPLLVAAGVTGFRDMGGRLEYVIPGRDALRSGTTLGPRAVVAGPIIDGAPAATEGDITVTSTAAARRAVDSLAQAGVDFIKVYEMLRRDQLLAIADQARAHHLPFAGHLPLVVEAGEASDLGMTSFEHLRNLELACSSKADSLLASRAKTLDSSVSLPGRAVRARIHSAQRPTAITTEDRERCDALIAKLARNGTWQTPTLFLDEIALVVSDSATLRRVRASEPYIPTELSSWWHDQLRSIAAAPEISMEPARRYARWLRALIPRLRHAGVGILAGSDMPNLLTAPGFSLHE
ncbi:MAG: hypothetical protein JWL61_4879, partial [Gemmatimonadetes bacterium]|nr:hypothetical protein [Gemmatimonadota bacterium]